MLFVTMWGMKTWGSYHLEATRSRMTEVRVVTRKVPRRLRAEPFRPRRCRAYQKYDSIRLLICPIGAGAMNAWKHSAASGRTTTEMATAAGRLQLSIWIMLFSAIVDCSGEANSVRRS